MKAVLVVDMPKNCAECKLMYLQGIGESICNAVDWEERPSWCPLKRMPEKKETDIETDLSSGDDYISGYKDGYNRGVDAGWNRCVSELS